MTEAPARDRLVSWVPESVVVAVLLVVGVADIERRVAYGFERAPMFGLLLVLLGAVALFRKQPGPALALVWLVGVLQIVWGVPVLPVEASVALVAFGCARWGSSAVVVLSGLSIPAAAGIAAFLVTRSAYGFFTDFALFREIVDNAYRFSDTLLVGAVVLGMLVLALPWLAGLLVRAIDRARRSEESQEAAEEDAAQAHREAAQAQEIARLREGQTQLARDVHDVVGHSLAVILAQAESAQFLPDDPERLKETMATIATSARASLQDVRHVLSDEPGEVRVADLERLVEGVRASGLEVTVVEDGAARPLPPDLEVVVQRVTQEMLTNAVKHGDRTGPVQISRDWPSSSLEQDLRIEVVNAVGDPDAEIGAGGQGVDGMRRRLDAVGGRLDVRRRGHTFTATAWVPVGRG